jgi:trk system potassium uptake protein TrkA
MAGVKGLFVIVVGCGRLGAYLANKLSNDGASVVAVDCQEKAFEALTGEYSGFRVEGDATEFAVLKQARMDQADIVIGATPDDNVNVMVAQIAQKVFHVPKVIVRIFEPRRLELCDALGIECVCPTSLASTLVLRSLEGSLPVAPDGGRE